MTTQRADARKRTDEAAEAAAIQRCIERRREVVLSSLEDVFPGVTMDEADALLLAFEDRAARVVVG